MREGSRDFYVTGLDKKSSHWHWIKVRSVFFKPVQYLSTSASNADEALNSVLFSRTKSNTGVANPDRVHPYQPSTWKISGLLLPQFKKDIDIKKHLVKSNIEPAVVALRIRRAITGMVESGGKRWGSSPFLLDCAIRGHRPCFEVFGGHSVSRL